MQISGLLHTRSWRGRPPLWAAPSLGSPLFPRPRGAARGWLPPARPVPCRGAAPEVLVSGGHLLQQAGDVVGDAGHGGRLCGARGRRSLRSVPGGPEAAGGAGPDGFGAGEAALPIKGSVRAQAVPLAARRARLGVPRVGQLSPQLLPFALSCPAKAVAAPGTRLERNVVAGGRGTAGPVVRGPACHV